MADIVFIAVALGFIGVCVAYVRGLDRLVQGADRPGAEHQEGKS